MIRVVRPRFCFKANSLKFNTNFSNFNHLTQPNPSVHNLQFKRYNSTTLESNYLIQSFESIVQLNSQFLQEINHIGQSLPIGWEWYHTIIFSTILIRSLTTFPLAIYNLKQVKKRKELNHVLSAWNSAYTKRPYIEFDRESNKNKSFLSIIQETKSMAKFTSKNLQSYYNLNPYTSLMAPWAQIPIFIINSATIRMMCGVSAFNITLPQLFERDLAEGGTLWFVNLIGSDPTLILPLCIGACHLANLSMSLEPPKSHHIIGSKFDYTQEPPPTPSKAQKYFKNLFTGIGGTMAIIFIPIAAISPSGLALYWLTSAAFSLVQNCMLRTKLIKRLFNI